MFFNPFAGAFSIHMCVYHRTKDFKRHTMKKKNKFYSIILFYIYDSILLCVYNTFNAFKSPCTFCNFLVVTGVSNTLHLFPKARFSHIRGCINYKYVCKLYIYLPSIHNTHTMVKFSSQESMHLKQSTFAWKNFSKKVLWWQFIQFYRQWSNSFECEEDVRPSFNRMGTFIVFQTKRQQMTRKYRWR